MEHETEQQVSAAAIDVALPSFMVPRPGSVIDVRPAPQPPRPAPRPEPLLPDLTAPAAPGFVYVMGTVEPRFPSLGVKAKIVPAIKDVCRRQAVHW